MPASLQELGLCGSGFVKNPCCLIFMLHFLLLGKKRTLSLDVPLVRQWLVFILSSDKIPCVLQTSERFGSSISILGEGKQLPSATPKKTRLDLGTDLIDFHAAIVKLSWNINRKQENVRTISIDQHLTYSAKQYILIVNAAF